MVVGGSGDTIVVEWERGVRDTVAMSDVTRLEVFQGVRQHVQAGALIGLAVGGVVGVIGQASMSKDFSSACDKKKNLFCAPAAGAVDGLGWAMVPVTALLGAGLGALIGRAGTEQWKEGTPRRVGTRVDLVPTMSTPRIALVVSGRF